MNTSTSQAGSPSQGHFSPPSFTDPHLNPSSPTDPITHRPPGRLSYRNTMASSPLQDNSPLHFRPPTSSAHSVMAHSADPSRAIHHDYSPPSYTPQFSHNPHQSFPVSPHSTPDTPSYQNPIRGTQAYEQEPPGVWYPQAAYSHGMVSDSPRGAPWAQADAGPISNIPRIFVNSQESTQSTYPSTAHFGSSGHAPRDNSLTPASDSSTNQSPDCRNSSLHFDPGHRYNTMDEYYARYHSADMDIDVSRNHQADASPPSQRSEGVRRQALSVPILRLDTTGLDHTASSSRDNFRSPSLATSPRRGLTSPYETPSPNPPSASSNPSPNSSTSSSMPSPSPGSSPMTFVPFQPGLNAQVAHVISEDKSITDSALREVFPPSSQCPPVSASPQSQPARKWICQWPGCGKSVRRQDRVAHALEHHGRKRFACSCGGSFARSQDKKRHLREQAICRLCPRSVGRNGYRGICPTCSQDNNNGAGRGGGGGAPYSA